MFKKNIFFGNRILLFVSLLLILTVLLTIYLMSIIRNSELSLLEHQKARLNQAAYMFDQSVEGSINEYLATHNKENLTRQEKILILEEYINPIIHSINREYPEVHIGLYYSDLDIFLDGTRVLKENYSLRRKRAFQVVLDTGSSLSQNLGQEEGGILEVYKPFTRNGEVEGVIRSAEYLQETSYYAKRREVEYNVYSIIVLVVITGIAGSMFIFRQLINQVEDIKDGVKLLEKDLSKTLPPAPGELGEIVDAINGFAQKISDLNVYNETMLAAIDDAILVVDVGGRVMIANNMARKLMDLPEDCLEYNYRDLLPSSSPFAELIGRTLEERRNMKDLNVSYAKNGHNVLQLVVSTSILIRPGGTFIGVVLLCRDITERVRMREKAQRQERLASLGKLVTGVAHEIRNPLTSISCYIQHWQNQHTPNPRALATMHREVARLDAIVDQLLYFAKPAEARFKFKDLNALVKGILDFFHEIHQGKYNIITELDKDIPRAWIDPEQIERVLVNILFNALQAMPEGGTVTIRTGYEEDTEQVFVSIADTGCGIPREHLAHLFDPFFSGRPKGTGLGLAIAHEIIQVHGGHIEVESEVGKGSKFTFYLKTREDV
ncbi:two-component system sensor histidine kinase AtoS [Desulfallas thermosapovorans]|uniref:histidine kinase n=1 Tax=Desulfallas thermosapovorans DSM 6562 TaxID=1121431 RepID=A0A5S4ZMQ4_9FIRM|nr:two-component system sensor histidine kinase AtoS [Desulfallas thermosapovorans]TYO92312.1 two-component system sensor histidine kinase AtoS [Desulfallas thermosapovorans DSM 6562]